MVKIEEIGWSTLQNMEFKELLELREKCQNILYERQKERLTIIQNIIWIQNELKKYEKVE